MRKNRILSVAIFTALFTLLGVINSFSATGDTYNSANDYSATSQGVNGWYYEYAQQIGRASCRERVSHGV